MAECWQQPAKVKGVCVGGGGGGRGKGGWKRGYIQVHYSQAHHIKIYDQPLLRFEVLCHYSQNNHSSGS